MTATEKQQHEAFLAAKKIALTISEGERRRARHSDCASNYFGANVGGRFYVLGDTEADIQNPDCFIDGMPAREVFDGFTCMSAS